MNQAVAAAAAMLQIETQGRVLIVGLNLSLIHI